MNYKAFTSYTKRLLLLFLIGAGLLFLEAALEYRTHARGFSTLLFGSVVVSGDVETAGEFGPAADFPFRSRIVPKDRQPGIARIWVASSSYGEDLAIPAPEIFPQLIGRYLGEAGWQTEILNASRAGFGLPENLSDMRSGMADWKPDVAVLYTMANDINNLSKLFLDPGAPVPPPDAPLPADGTHMNAAPSTPWYTRFVESTKLYQGVKSKITPQFAAERILSNQFPPAACERFRQELNSFVAICREQGITPVLCTFAVNPIAFDGGAPAHRILLSRLRYNLYLSIAGWQDAVDSLNQTIRLFGTENNVLVIDIAPELDHAANFRDFVHFTLQGHKLAAQVMARGIRQILPGTRGSQP